jgi:hypothetical protein
MAHAYAPFDWEVADYQTFLLDPELKDRQTGEGLLIRGPRPQNLNDGEYFVCIGAAQTFGRFCEKPYPTLLRESLQLEVLNLARGGAGPSFFSEDNSVLLDYMNRAKFAVIQVMSGRSESNSEFHSNGLGFYTRVSDGSWIDCDEAFRELMQKNDMNRLKRIVAETRLNWIESYERLFGSITVPKVLLWFSTRKPHYDEGYDTIESLFGAFPQMVNASMVAHLKGICDHYVEVVTSRGYPHRLTSRFTGEPVLVVDDWGGKWTENWYYPSPEMHIDAAHELDKTVRKHLISHGSSPLARLRRALSRPIGRRRRG